MPGGSSVTRTRSKRVRAGRNAGPRRDATALLAGSSLAELAAARSCERPQPHCRGRCGLTCRYSLPTKRSSRSAQPAAPLARCDLDHTVDAALGGSTATNNLAALCRGHHTLKHHGGWRVRQKADGGLDWQSPTGRQYRERPPSAVRFAAATTVRFAAANTAAGAAPGATAGTAARTIPSD